MSVTPNVEEVSQPDEKQALQRRYWIEMGRAAKRGAKKTLRQFRSKVSYSKAVINADLRWLHSVVVKNESYWNYYDQKKNKGKSVDTAREMVDVWLHHQYGPNIRYAALSLNNTGLTSYGKYCMCLQSSKLENCATVLEENCFVFLGKQKWSPLEEEKQKVPYGYRAVWKKRGELAAAKLGGKVQNKVTNFAELLLINTGDRKTDDFIEVHIHSTIDKTWIELVRGPSVTKSKIEEGLLKTMINSLKGKGKKWEPIQ